jgi:hypothetical protein
MIAMEQSIATSCVCSTLAVKTIIGGNGGGRGIDESPPPYRWAVELNGSLSLRRWAIRLAALFLD